MISSSSSEIPGSGDGAAAAPFLSVEDSQRARFVEAVVPLLRAALGKVEVCDMTDASGFYLDGVLFGLVSGGRLHFRVDASNRAEYDAWDRETAANVFGPPGASGGLKFRVVPPFVLDDEDLMAEWGRRAFEAAKRARRSAG